METYRGGGQKNVLLTFDKAYLYQTGNLILTLNKYNEDLFFYLFFEKADEESIKYLSSLGVKIKLYDFEIDIDVGEKRWPALTVLRLFAPYIIEDDIDKLLYLDSDIVCKGNIDALFTVPTNGFIIAIASEVSGNFSDKQLFKTYPADLYGNSGGTVFDIKKYKIEHSYESLYKALLSIIDKLDYPDQDFLNYYFHGKIHFLKQEYNFVVSDYLGYMRYKEALDMAKLLHFTIKPWKWKTRYCIQKTFIKYSIDKTIKKQVHSAIVKGFFLRPLRYLLFLAYQPFKKIKQLLLLKENFLLKK